MSRKSITDLAERFMAYMDALIDRGDTFFRQDTRESICEAIQFYMLAVDILGARPSASDEKHAIMRQSYVNSPENVDELDKKMYERGNALVICKNDLSFNLISPTSKFLIDLGKLLFSYIPHNDKLIGYWDTVDERLFKISENLNIQGIPRQFPIFEPSIKPALLKEISSRVLSKRERDCTKHISILRVNPLALIQLRAFGICTFTIPEVAFDMDFPGDYFRRIKNVGVSIPLITGPCSINCELRLLSSSIRINSLISKSGYNPEGPDDERFSIHFENIASIVPITGQNDHVYFETNFETNFNEERFLPLEGAGVISKWRLELPANATKDANCQFDYGSIADVILYFRYTAKIGDESFKEKVMENFKARMDNSNGLPLDQ